MNNERYEIAYAIREIEAEYQSCVTRRGSGCDAGRGRNGSDDLYIFLFNYFFPMIEIKSENNICEGSKILASCQFRSTAKQSAKEHLDLFQTHFGFGIEDFGNGYFSAYVDLSSAGIPGSYKDEAFGIRWSRFGYARTDLALQDEDSGSVCAVIEEKQIPEHMLVINTMRLITRKNKMGVIQVIREIEAEYQSRITVYGDDKIDSLFTFLFCYLFPLTKTISAPIADKKGRWLSFCEFIHTEDKRARAHLDVLAEHFDLCYYHQRFDAYVDCKSDEYYESIARFGETEDYTWRDLNTGFVLRDDDFLTLIEKEQIRQFMLVVKVMELYEEITSQRGKE